MWWWGSWNPLDLPWWGFVVLGVVGFFLGVLGWLDE